MRCIYCGQETPDNPHRRACYACSEVLRKSIREQKRVYLEDVKTANPCARCGEADVDVLELHHLDRTTKRKVRSDTSGGGISMMLGSGYSLRLFVGELNKCVVLCANCHRKITKRPELDVEFVPLQLELPGWAVALRGKRLTNDVVQAIRTRRAAGEKIEVLAAEYGVTLNAVYHVVNRRTYKNFK